MSELISKAERDTQKVERMCQSRRVERSAEQYISYCLSEETPRLPNISGFFRWLKLSAAARDHFKAAHPDEYKTVKMIFEDEALNSPLPPSIVSAYMKQFFLSEENETMARAGGITLSFEHDIERDGE